MRQILYILLGLILPIMPIHSQTAENMKKAFIIIDIQNDYFEGGANPLVGSYQASVNAKHALAHCREQGIPVIHIQHIANREGATFFAPNTKGVEIHQNVTPINGEKVIIKHFPNSFRETELQKVLKENNITDLIICGMMTSMCVDATTRAAKDMGYECTVIGDACAAPTLTLNGKTMKGEDVHTAFLAALSYFYAQVVTTQQFINNH